MKSPSIHWFRQDLRLADNPAFSHAVRDGSLLPIFILDDEAAGDYHYGSAGRWWLHRSLESLNRQLDGHLRCYHGQAQQILPALVAQYGAQQVSWTRCYEPWRRERDGALARALEIDGCEVTCLNGSLLWEPWEICKADGTPYRVFTPFFHKGCMLAQPPAVPIPAPTDIAYAYARDGDGAVALEALSLLPEVPWHETLEQHWRFGEEGAQAVLERFLASGLSGYGEGRNFPAKAHVSRLSPYLHWGQISPNQVWHRVTEWEKEKGAGSDVEHFRAEIGWREFSYHLLFHNQDLPNRPLQGRFEDFPWRVDPCALRAWQKGQTGVPIVDAGMRELWLSGYMHNRVRMIVASYLVKNLRIDWREGTAMVLGYIGGCRSRQQQRQLAVGDGVWC